MRYSPLLLLLTVSHVTFANESEHFFESRVRPLLAKHCFECHRETKKGGLRLDSREQILRGGDSGAAIVPGHPDQSLLLSAVSETDDTLRMPPGKRLAQHEIATLRQWIHDGAVWTNTIVDSEEDGNRLWAFDPLSIPEIPSIPSKPFPNPIDAFVEAQLAKNGLTANASADPTTLIRRATFDLTGLPPTPNEIRAFRERHARDPIAAFDDLIERLLSVPQYGERWGQHWLDLVRYADTAGDGADFPVPEAYKYRNYVIEAFNKDKPYDQFIKEQIAGDLLESQDDDERWEQIIATGYLAISRRIGVNPHNLKHIMLEDTIDNLGKTFLGLSVSCARCHDHKFDPIPTADYYALYGILDSTTFPHAGAEHKPWRQDFVYRIGKEESDELLKPFRDELAVINKIEREKLEEYRDFQRMPIDDPTKTRETTWKIVLQVRDQQRRVAETFPDLEIAFAVQDGTPHDAYVQKGGDPAKKSRGPKVKRRFLTSLGGQELPAGTEGSGRLHLAEWIADPANPLTARVIVNRIWHHHFGSGIVKTTNDFGVRGAPPTHPKLLDFLANEFIANGWSIKHLHRLIMQSQTYQRSSQTQAGNHAIDPNNDFLWRANRRRLDAEQLRDSILQFAGILDKEPGARHPFPHRLTYFFRQHEPFVGNYETNQRTIYQMRQRIKKNDYLDLFDGPDGNLPFARRRETTTTLQALFFMNSEFMHEHSKLIAQRFYSAGKAEDEIASELYSTLFGRTPSATELTTTNHLIDQLESQLAADKTVANSPTDVWSAYVRAMLASNEFLFVD